MRCEECLPLVEEYFDGEVEETVAARMGAHLSACADCAAALDALSFEQEVYARYDRGGLEVSPNLWARVSAEIAREPRVEPRPQPFFLSRLREQLAALFGPLALRPALASSFALLLLAVTAGSLWLAREERTIPPAEVAGSAPGAPAGTNRTDERRGGVAAAASSGSLNAEPAGAGSTSVESLGIASTEVASAQRTAGAAPGPVAFEDDVERLLALPTGPQASPNIVVIRPDEHAGTDEAEALFVNTAAAMGRDSTAGDERLPDASEKDVARHVERAQMLLRSIKNTRAADESSTLDVAYERELSRRLLAENATLQLDAEVKGDKETKQVLDQIEPFLIDIANLRDRASRDEVRSIGERVRKHEIVAALQVY